MRGREIKTALAASLIISAFACREVSVGPSLGISGASEMPAETPGDESGTPSASLPGVIFEDNFDSQPDFWPVQARPQSGCDPATGKDTNGKLVFHGNRCAPIGWSAARNDEAWNPFDASGGTAATPGAHPTIEISGDNHFGPSGKSFTVWNESHSGWSGDGWGADGIIAKKFDVEYPEIYIRFKYKLNGVTQWTSYNGGAQMKTFRAEHSDAGASSLFSNFEKGTNAPIAMLQIGVGWSGSTPLMGASHQTRCDPQNWDYVNYEGASYKCMLSHGSGDSILPTSGTYWQAVTYSASYPLWQVDRDYYKSNYYCDDGMGYITSSRFVTSSGDESTSVTETLGDGNWHTFDFHLKMNSANGVADGVYQFLADGVLKVDKHDRVFLGDGATPGIGWNTISLGGNANNNYKHITSSYLANYVADAEQSYSIDDVVVSTGPIPQEYVVGTSPADPAELD